MLRGCLVPVVIDLVDRDNRHVECTSVMVSVTTPREDGTYEVDLARFMWYFGHAATYGPRPAHMPLYQQQVQYDLSPCPYRGRPAQDYASSSSRESSGPRSTPSSGFGRRILKVTKRVFSTPLGAGVPVYYAPEPYVEAAPHSYNYYTTPYGGRVASPSESLAPPDPYSPTHTDSKGSVLTGAYWRDRPGWDDTWAFGWPIHA